jgi:hypothetical protein
MHTWSENSGVNSGNLSCSSQILQYYSKQIHLLEGGTGDTGKEEQETSNPRAEARTGKGQKFAHSSASPMFLDSRGCCCSEHSYTSQFPKCPRPLSIRDWTYDLV